MDIHALPEPLQNLVNDELTAGERVRWVGQPVPRVGFPLAALVPFLFAIPWTGFALFWMTQASGVLERPLNQIDSSRLLFALFGVPFVLVGLGLFASPFWMRARARQAAARTVYVITDRRAIVFDGGYYGDGSLPLMLVSMVRPYGRGGTRVTSYTPDQLTKIERMQNADGSGNLVFGETLFLTEYRSIGTMHRAGFFSIADVREAENQLRALAATTTPPTD